MSEWEGRSGDFGASIDATPVVATPEGVEAGVDMLFQNYMELAVNAKNQAHGKSVKDKVSMMFLLLKTLYESSRLNMDGLLGLVQDLAVDEEMGQFEKELRDALRNNPNLDLGEDNGTN